MIAPSPWTTSFLGLCNTSTRTCDKKYKLSCLWLQDYPWKFRLSAPLMTIEGSNFYNTRSWDFSRNNTGRKHERAFWVQNPRYKRGTLLSLKRLENPTYGELMMSFKYWKNGLRFGLQTDKLWPFYVCWFLLIYDFWSKESNFRSIESCRNWIVISCNYSIPNLI